MKGGGSWCEEEDLGEGEDEDLGLGGEALGVRRSVWVKKGYLLV